MKHLRIIKIACLLLALATALLFSGCAELLNAADAVINSELGQLDTPVIDDGETAETPRTSETAKPQSNDDCEQAIDEYGSYTKKDDVALYIHTYGRLPDNFISKSEAKKKGWEGGSVEDYFPGCSIGGDRFGNYEGLLPKADGRTYTECDIDTLGKSSRGAKRIVFSNDGLVYYTDDHYESFTLMYGEE